MGILISPKRLFDVPGHARCITPDTFSTLSLSEILNLEVHEGNRKRKLKELFEVSTGPYTSPEGFTIWMKGDFSKVRYIGYGMSTGKIVLEGVAGMHLGEEMKGGFIQVYGDAGSWVGSMMRGGKIEVFGDVGDYTGAAYRGSGRGMRGGEIIVHGNALNETGCYMRGGLIKVYGSVGQFTGMHMHGGTIMVGGETEGRDGAEMTKGKIVILGKVPSLLPTFKIEAIKPRVKVGEERVEGPFYMFTGDLAENGEGKLYVSKNKNPHLKEFEKYLSPVKVR